MNENEKQTRKPKDVDLSTLDDSAGDVIESVLLEPLASIREILEDMQRPWQEIAQSINDLVGPLAGISVSLKQTSDLSEGMKGILDLSEGMKEILSEGTMKEILGEGTRNTEQFSKILGDAMQHAQAFDGISQLGKHVRQTTSIFEPWRPYFKSLTEPSIAPFPDIQRRCLKNFKLLAEHGWFPDPHMPLGLLSRLATTIGEDPSEVDAVFGQHLKGQLSEVEEELTKLSPERAHLIRDAFWAHRQGRYSLSIPVFLSQADGLWFDQFKQSVFMGRDREGAHKDNPTQFESTYFRLFDALRIATLPIWISKREREETFSDLNRHQVLHGEVVDYNTEENSLKAISFLRWLCWTFSEMDLSKSSSN